MARREKTWTERRPFPAKSVEKYGDTTAWPGTPQARANVVEATNVAAESESELHGRNLHRPEGDDDSEFGGPSRDLYRKVLEAQEKKAEHLVFERPEHPPEVPGSHTRGQWILPGKPLRTEQDRELDARYERPSRPSVA